MHQGASSIDRPSDAHVHSLIRSGRIAFVTFPAGGWSRARDVRPAEASRQPREAEIVLDGDAGLADTVFRGSMTADDFRRVALSFEGAEEGSHMGAVDFRVGGRIFATLASVRQGYGNLMLTRDQQQAFIAEWPHLFLPITGGWGEAGMTHIRLAECDEQVLRGALHVAWKRRVELNSKTRQPRPRPSRRK